MSHQSIQPMQPLERIPSLDFLRGVAILGILFVNTESFAYYDPWSSWEFGFENQLDHHARFWVYFLTQGKFYSMFTLLFGAGFVIFMERLEKNKTGSKSIDIYARRLLWLFVFGVLHAYFIWDGDVLYHYSICGLLLIPFRSFKNHNLILVILILASFLVIKQCEVTQKRQMIEKEYLAAVNVSEAYRTEKQSQRINSWVKRYSKKSPNLSNIENPKPTYIEGLKKSYQHITVHKGELYYQSLLFPSLIMMFVGMLFYRSGIFANYRAWKHYWMISYTVLLFGLTINYLRYYQWTYEDHVAVTNIWQGLAYTFTKESLGVGYILVLNGIHQMFFMNSNVGIISQIGRTAFSNYILQSIILGLIFYGYGFGMFNFISRFELLVVVVCIWLVQIVITLRWLRYRAQGPLEGLWRKLTYNTFTVRK